MDKRVKYVIVLDTETAPIVKSEKVRASNMLVYDIGYAIVDKRGNVYRSRSFVVDEIFNGERSRMLSSYYNDKLPKYIADLESGARTLASFYDIRQTLLSDIKEFGITEIYAHNMYFDFTALNTTMKWISKKYYYYFPSNLTLCCTQKMSRQVIGKTPTYTKFCRDNGYLTTTGQNQLKAEVLYKYLSLDNDFEEEHTGLADVMIEKEIMSRCFAKHKKMDRVFRSKKVA